MFCSRQSESRERKSVNSEHEIEILLVEDNPYDVELALIALNKRHLANKVVHVKDGEQALEFLFCTGAYAARDRNSHPKLVLLDLKLPNVDGFEVLRAIKTNPEMRHIAVVVMISSKSQKDRLDEYQLGVNSYIVKPVTFEKLSVAVAELECYCLLLNK
jgi:two-component system response regulator